uniref:Transketolase-like pyrimidine-binding domain-containing protein n=1 Tax=Odontella aurita TaxID=265563 RepID=A0A7S4MSH1_9STRA|mmetsp:Transcript_30678/g.91810  ORF Transcript_30678/g.91810 Transcript_30678/m.91810 type:complete len:704 (+) Transcript_30678:268-2379(+)|eukprot:CAMPEP_0113562164 /NCGR_PEP_ID=MMETSP0015_2-20120614/20377_1 /TAXON_ID=2838 /ORGANISM="Odontella" /LENGTH=703 /DNA_ID=CAMNT_0000464035 /DNA_START=106 /DNA_END=2217 /DNA_ORIENTATION=- /assembly_acc=CAM_ASM_000160
MTASSENGAGATAPAIDPIHQSFCHDASIPPMTTDSTHYSALRESLHGADDELNVFPFDLSSYRKISIDPFSTEALSESQLSDVKHNIDLCRDVIVFFTSCGSASGYGGHTGGAYDTVPEVVLFDAFFRARPDKFVPVFYDEAGHRVATQYLMSALDGYIAPEFLRFYRKGGSKLPGHPELGLTPGVQFSSGRLGHMWGTVNGIAMANPDKIVLMLGSDGSEMEGNNAEAARLAVARGLNVKLVLDDNDITITGHPAEYLPGFSVEKTLEGHGLKTRNAKGEDVADLYAACRAMLRVDGPAAVVCKRSMAPGIDGVEGTSQGHDAVAVKSAVPYLESKGRKDAVKYLELPTKTKDPKTYEGVGAYDAMRKTVGQTVVDVLGQMDAAKRKETVMVIDSDLGGSTNFNKIQAAYPEIYVQSGVMERGNFAAAAGFGMHPSKQGVFSTFAAFLEMCCSEITMARLNRSNVFCHFSHSGVDDMADNTCHFGLNNLFADNGVEEEGGYKTMLYFPADVRQAAAVVKRTFPLEVDGASNKGMRFVFTTRSKTPLLLKDDGETELYGDDYNFVPGKDEIVREGTAGYIVSFGDALYRCLDAVTALKSQGIDVGLINKPTLNVVDTDTMEKIAASPLCLVVECLGHKTGLGSKFGSWLLETDRAQKGGDVCKFSRIATHKEGGGGLWEQAYHQGYDSESVQGRVKSMLGKE